VVIEMCIKFSKDLGPGTGQNAPVEVVVMAMRRVSFPVQRVSFLTRIGDEKFFRAGGPEIIGRQWDRSPGPSHKVPVAVLRMKIGVELRPGRVGGWSRPMR
jgi:hypothetical protein